MALTYLTLSVHTYGDLLLNEQQNLEGLNLVTRVVTVYDWMLSLPLTFLKIQIKMLFHLLPSIFFFYQIKFLTPLLLILTSVVLRLEMQPIGTKIAFFICIIIVYNNRILHL